MIAHQKALVTVTDNSYYSGNQYLFQFQDKTSNNSWNFKR
jgi:hypothetical protein